MTPVILTILLLLSLGNLTYGEEAKIQGEGPIPSPVPLGLPKADISVLGLPNIPEVWPTGETIFLLGKNSIRATSPKSIRWVVSPKEREDRSVSLIDPTLGPVLALSPGPYPIVITITQIVTLADEIDTTSVTITFLSGDQPSPNPSPNPSPRPQPPIPKPTPFSQSLTELLTTHPLTEEIRTHISASLLEAITPPPSSQSELTSRTTSALTKKIGVDRFLKEVYPWRVKFTLLIDKETGADRVNPPVDISTYIKLWSEASKVLKPKE